MSDVILTTWHGVGEARGAAYRTVQHAVALVSALLDVVLQGSRVQRFQQLEGAEEFAGD